MDRWKVLSLFLAFIGCFFVVEAYSVSFFSLDRQGLIAGLLSAGFFSFYSLLGERLMRKYSPWTVLLYAFAFATILLIVFSHQKISLYGKQIFALLSPLSILYHLERQSPLGFILWG